MSNYELAHFKTLLTETHDSFRRKYSRHDVTMPRGFVMYGSTNDAHFLPADDTGHRRYVVVETGQVLFDKLNADKSQLWAEAVHLFRSGEVDYTQVQASKEQRDTYVECGPEYDELVDAVVADYAAYKGGDGKYGPAPVVGELKDIDGVECWVCTLGDWRKNAGLHIPKGRAGVALNHVLRMKGWLQKDQMRVRGQKRSKVWCVPTSLLD